MFASIEMAWQDRAYNRDDSGGVPPVVFSFPKLSRLTIAIISICFVAFLLQSFLRPDPMGRIHSEEQLQDLLQNDPLAFSNPLTHWGGLSIYHGLAFKQPWRWVTYQYLHGSASHFFFNMIGLYFFLPSLELMWGWRKALVFYTLGGIAGGIVYAILSLLVSNPGPLIGASGSIFAALGAVALLNPSRQLILLFFAVPIRMAAALFGAFFLLATITDKDFASAAHLGGLAFGFFAPWIGGPVLIRTERNWSKRRATSTIRAEQVEQLKIDTILEKVHQQGMNSLSWAEKRALKQATERQRRADADRARRVTR